MRGYHGRCDIWTLSFSCVTVSLLLPATSLPKRSRKNCCSSHPELLHLLYMLPRKITGQSQTLVPILTALDVQAGQLRPNPGKGRVHQISEVVLLHLWAQAQPTMERPSPGNKAQVTYCPCARYIGHHQTTSQVHVAPHARNSLVFGPGVSASLRRYQLNCTSVMFACHVHHIVVLRTSWASLPPALPSSMKGSRTTAPFFHRNLHAQVPPQRQGLRWPPL